MKAVETLRELRAHFTSEQSEALVSAMERNEPLDEIRGDLGKVKADASAIKVDIAVLKWMMGFVLALLVAILWKVFQG